MVEVEEILSEEQSEETSPNTRAIAAIQLTDNDDDDDDDDAEDHGWQELMGEDIMMKVMIYMCCSSKEEPHYNVARLSLLQLLSCIFFFFKSFTLSYMAYGFLRSFWSFLFQVLETKPPGTLPSDTNPSIGPQDAVLIQLVGRMAPTKEDRAGPIFQDVHNWFIVVGDGEVVPAVELAIRFMHPGQTCAVWSHAKYALGSGTRKLVPHHSRRRRTKRTKETTPSEDEDENEDDDAAVRTAAASYMPPSSNVMYEVTVVQKVRDTSRLNPYFTIQKAVTKKKIANDIYQNEWCRPRPRSSSSSNADADAAAVITVEKAPDCTIAMARAIRLYTQAAKDMDTLLEGTYMKNVAPEHPQKQEAEQLVRAALNNIVVVYLRQQQYHAAKLAAVTVLQRDPTNSKALLRATKAALYDPASTYAEVKAALGAAEQQILHHNTTTTTTIAEQQELVRLQVDLKKKHKEYTQRTKQMFHNKLSGQIETPSPAATAAATSITQENKTNDHRDNSEATVRQEEADATQTTKEDDDDSGDEEETTPSFWDLWKEQVRTMLLQIFLPFVVVFVYRKYVVDMAGLAS